MANAATLEKPFLVLPSDVSFVRNLMTSAHNEALNAHDAIAAKLTPAEEAEWQRYRAHVADIGKQYDDAWFPNTESYWLAFKDAAVAGDEWRDRFVKVGATNVLPVADDPNKAKTSVDPTSAHTGQLADAIAPFAPYVIGAIALAVLVPMIGPILSGIVARSVRP